MTADAVRGSRRRQIPWYERYVNILGPVVMIATLCLVMAFIEPGFFRLSNLMIILQDASIYMVLAMGMTLVITGRGIDLSIGAIAALSAVVMALLIKDLGLNVVAGMAIAVLVGVACGAANGFVITRVHVPDLIATLSMDLVYRGIALVLAAGVVLSRFPEPIPFLGRGRLFDLVPVAALIGIGTIGVGFLLYRYSALGRYAIAIGGNTESAELAGIDVARHKLYQYMLMGGLAGFAGIMLTGRLNAIQATSGQGLTLHTIAAVVVGGTSLFGGRGSMLGSLVGVLLLSMVINALVNLRLDFFWQQVAAGIIIIVSVGFYSSLQGGGGALRVRLQWWRRRVLGAAKRT
ncbi:MAG: ABC transporter permease [Albidovulum sp.]|nr:ABC transporter permease [Albidovulum sp.]MDE0532063.1 ABC transporter permease [Albidovulum sp.]